MYFIGYGRYGKIDRIPDERHVVTMFFHFNFIPLIPMYTLEISEHPDTYDQARKIDFSWRSVLMAWGNVLYVVAIFMSVIIGFLAACMMLGGHFDKLITYVSLFAFLLSVGLSVGLHYGLAWYASAEYGGVLTDTGERLLISHVDQDLISVKCPFCKSQNEVDRELSGQRTKCNFCSKSIVVPWDQQSADDEGNAQHEVKSSSLLFKVILVVVGTASIMALIVFTSKPELGPQQQQPLHNVAPGHPPLPGFQRPTDPPAPDAVSTPPANEAPASVAPSVTAETRDPHGEKGSPANRANMNGPERPQPTLPVPNQPTPASTTSDAPQQPGAATGPRGTIAVKKSKLVGGTGGTPFGRGVKGQAMVGLDWKMGAWAGENAIAAVFPVAAAGTPNAGCQQVVAPPGYAVGGINVCAPIYVSHLQLIYMKQRDDGTLDPDDTRLSDWLGGAPKGDVVKISADGKPVIGLHGRGAAVIDAIGIVTRP